MKTSFKILSMILCLAVLTMGMAACHMPKIGTSAPTEAPVIVPEEPAEEAKEPADEPKEEVKDEEK